ncbi:MAG: hypothetical protein LAT67_10255 [Balneolales bacterium]|nr:hypothetical protein [Balneolales bacterium]
MSTVKTRLLAISEAIVDISDKLDELEFEPQSAKRFELFKQLRSFGDELIAIKEKTEGDDNAYASFALGSVCSLLGYFDKAEEAYDEALLHWPDHVGILNEAFDILVEAGKFKKAKIFIERSIKHGGETPDVLFNYASLVSHMGNTDEARIILINTLAKFPDDRGCKALLDELDAAAKTRTSS